MPERARAANGRHLERLLGRERLRIHRRDLLQLGREVHLLEHIEIVVAARRAVGARARPAMSSAQHTSAPARRRSPVSCCSTGSAPRPRRAPSGSPCRPSSTHTPCAATVRPFSTPRRSSTSVGRHIALGHQFVVLLLGFREMNHQRRVVAVGQRPRRPSASRRNWCRARAAPRPARSADRSGSARRNFSVRFSASAGVLASGDREADDRLARARRACRLPSWPPPPLPRSSTCRCTWSCRDSSISRQARRVPQRTKSGRDVLRFGGKDEFLQPVLQPQVVRDAAEQRHRRMRVGIDQARARGSRRAGRALLGLKPLVDLGPVPTATMRSPAIATAPFSITRRCASIVIT